MARDTQAIRLSDEQVDWINQNLEGEQAAAYLRKLAVEESSEFDPDGPVTHALEKGEDGFLRLVLRNDASGDPLPWPLPDPAA